MLWKAVWPLFSAVLAGPSAAFSCLACTRHADVSSSFWAAGVSGCGGVPSWAGFTMPCRNGSEMPTRQRDALDRLGRHDEGSGRFRRMLDEQAIGAWTTRASAGGLARPPSPHDRARAGGQRRVPCPNICGLLIAGTLTPCAYVAALLLRRLRLLFRIFRWPGLVLSRDMAPQGEQRWRSGPVWEGWAESPRYTGRPTIYLNDIEDAGAGPSGGHV